MARTGRARRTDAQIDRQLEAGRARYDQKHEAGLHATHVRHDRTRKRFVLELTNGYLLGVPTSALPQLAEASAAQLAAVELSPAGMALRVPALDADFSVSGLVLSLTAGVIGQRGGTSTSTRKKRAARANGAKGGRPRKNTAA